MFKKFLQSRQFKHGSSKLNLEGRDSVPSNKAKPVRLPEEIILQIFEAVARDYIEYEEGYSVDRWWEVPDGYSAFFKSAGCVCKSWRCLARDFQGPTRISVARFVSAKAWRASSSGHPMKIERLHLVEGDYFIDKKRSRLPKALPDCLLASSNSITSLSFEVILLRYPVLKTFLLDVASTVRRLQLYCDPSEKSMSHFAFFWSDVFSDGAMPHLKELALIGLVVYGGATAGIPPCSANVIMLEDTVFDFKERDVDWTLLFPQASRLTISRYFHSASLGISLNSSSPTLCNLDITWNGSFHPLTSEAKILSSHNLAELTIVVVTGTGSYSWPVQEDCPIRYTLPSMPNVKNIIILGAAELIRMDHLASFCSRFAELDFCPKVKQVTLRTRRRSVRYGTESGWISHEPSATREECQQIALGLEGLQRRRRDMEIGVEQPAHSIWSYAAEPPVYTFL